MLNGLVLIALGPPSRVTRIAVRTVIHITRHLTMLGVHVRSSMTAEAGKNGVVAGIGMAVAAGRPLVVVGAAVYLETDMFKLRPAPRGCRVTLSAVQRENGGKMGRIGGVVVVRRVACIAIGGEADILAADRKSVV